MFDFLFEMQTIDKRQQQSITNNGRKKKKRVPFNNLYP